jgi:hypothetical protein
MMLGAVERLMMLKSEFGGYNNWIDLQLYPASLALYAIGLGFVAAENYKAFKALARDFRTSAGELNRRINSAMERLGLQGVINTDLLNSAINQRQHVPCSERVHQLFSSIFLKQLPGVVAFDDLFDRFEFLCALVVADTRMQDETRWICGWFGRWIYRNRDYGENIRSTVKAERDRLGKDWAPIQTGVFASTERFDEIFERHRTDCVSRFPHY